MKTMKIFEPAMCCPTGLCGVSVDPELLRVSTVLNTLKENGVEVQRYNLTSAPMEFVNHTAVAEFLKKFGPEKLPAIMVDDFIVISGRYPSNEEFTSWLELSPELLGGEDCCEDSPCCCGGEETTEDSGCCCGDTDAEESSCCSGEDNASKGCCEEAPASDKNSEGCCCGSECC